MPKRRSGLLHIIANLTTSNIISDNLLFGDGKIGKTMRFVDAFNGPPNVLCVRCRKTMFLRRFISSQGAERLPRSWPDSDMCVCSDCNFGQTKLYRHMIHVVYPTFLNNPRRSQNLDSEKLNCHFTAPTSQFQNSHIVL